MSKLTAATAGGLDNTYHEHTLCFHGTDDGNNCDISDYGKKLYQTNFFIRTS